MIDLEVPLETPRQAPSEARQASRVEAPLPPDPIAMIAASARPWDAAGQRIINRGREIRAITPVQLAVSIVVPALNEAENLPRLLPRVDRAMRAYLGTRQYEILIVDDNSRDNTRYVCEELAQRYPLKLILREHPSNGLSGAVLHGIGFARGQMLAVMDADLQHPPEKLPALLHAVEHERADFAIGSRYMPGGSTECEWGMLRRLNSSIATALARPFSGRTHDPMSGFFALSRDTFEQAERLTPLGYKIALELMCKCRALRVKEVPIHFSLRTHGKSKLSLKQQFKYLEHLSRLYDFTYPRLAPMLKFVIATGISWLVGLASIVLFLMIRQTGIGPTGMAKTTSAGYLAAIFALSAFHLRYVRTQRAFLLTRRPWADFLLTSGVEWLTCTIAAIWLATRLRHPGLSDLFIPCFAVGTLTRYVLRKELRQDRRSARGKPKPSSLF